MIRALDIGELSVGLDSKISDVLDYELLFRFLTIPSRNILKIFSKRIRVGEKK